MPSSCSAFGCTYRHKKGDNIGLFQFPKDETLRRMWTIAVRRLNWEPSPSSRICGKHFQSGRPCNVKDHPDYVPNIFLFNQNKQTTRKRRKIAPKKEISLGTSTDVSGNKTLQAKPDRNFRYPPVPVTANKTGKCPLKPTVSSCNFSKVMKENDNEKRENFDVSNNSQEVLIQKEAPALPQRVWILNLFPPKKYPVKSLENLNDERNNTTSLASVIECLSIPTSDTSIADCEHPNPLSYVETSLATNEDSILSDESTLTAKSSILASEDDVPPFSGCDDSIISNVNSSVTASKDPIIAYVNISEATSKDSFISCDNSSAVAMKDNATCRVEAANEKIATLNSVKCQSGNVKDNLVTMPTSAAEPVKESTGYDYSYFKVSPDDTKEILAIKLETMLAVNLSLQEKVKFYQNKCKLYEKEINKLTNRVQNLELKNSVTDNR